LAGEMVVQAFGFQCSRPEKVDVADCLSCKTTKVRKIKLWKFFCGTKFSIAPN